MDNVQGITESVLIIFGGLVAEVNAPDVPAGSSPLCCDMDFTVASAKSRDGLASVYGGAAGVIYSDGFNYPQGTGIGGNWVILDGELGIGPFGAYGIEGNESPALMYYAAPVPSNQFSEVTISAVGSSGNSVGPAVRISSGPYCYFAFWSGTAISLYVLTPGPTFYLVPGGPSYSPSVGDVIRLEANGSVLTIKINGFSVFTYTDTLTAPPISQGAVGVVAYGT